MTFEEWSDSAPLHEHIRRFSRVEPYVPGQFSLRELPFILAMLAMLAARPETVIIDGYVWLDAAGRPGLGGRLYRELDEQVPVIGAAKTRFRTASHAIEVFRGSSRRPLLVTAAGMDPHEAARRIRNMHGPHRIPTLLALVDRLSRPDH